MEGWLDVVFGGCEVELFVTVLLDYWELLWFPFVLLLMFVGVFCWGVKFADVDGC